MRKYCTLCFEYFQSFLSYRLALILLMLGQFAAPAIMIIVFTALPVDKFAGMTKDQLVNYYLFTGFLFLLTSSSADTFVKFSIYDGTISSNLIKPFRFWLTVLVRDLSIIFLKLILGIPLLLLLFFIFKPTFSFSFDLPLNLMLVLIAYFLSFTLAFATGLLAFWIEEVWGFQNLKDVIIALLGGVMLPYQFFPQALKSIIQWTPFPYLVSWPLRKGYTGNFSLEIIISLFWLTFLTLLLIWMWGKGIKKYTGIGM